MIRGDIDPSTGLCFWRYIRGKPMFISAALLRERQETEKKRQERFYHNHPNYIPYSHTSAETQKRSKEYRTMHPDRIYAYHKKWRSQNMDKLRLLSKTRYAKDANVRARILTSSALRRSQQDRLTGTNRIEVNFLYALSKALSSGGVKHVVDHFLPIKPHTDCILDWQIVLILGLSHSTLTLSRRTNVHFMKKPHNEQQVQNAQIGKVGTAPAAMGQMDTQQMAQQWTNQCLT